jgi:hypothetical protein
VAVALTAGVAVALHEAKLSVFAVGADGSLYQVEQTQPGGGWTGWQSLGNPGTPVGPSPAAGLLNVIDGFALQVVVATDDLSIWRRTRISSGDPWGAWESLPGVSAPGPVALTLDAGAVNHYFAADGSGTLQESTGGAWMAHPGPEVVAPSVAASADGRLEVFAVTSQGALEHQWQLAGGGWSGWFSHGSPQSGTIENQQVALGASADGRLELFAVAADWQLYHIWQTAVNNGWSGWYSHGNGGARLGWPPAVAASADGRLEVFAVGADGQLYHIWQTAVNNGWSGWYSHGNGGAILTPPAVAASADGRLEVFAVGADGQLYHIWQTAVNNGWSGWYSHGSP